MGWPNAKCDHRGYPVIGHGMEKGDQLFCCAHCASYAGATELRDRA